MAKNKDKEDGSGKELTFDKLLAAHKQNIGRKILAGETGLSRELEHLQELENKSKGGKPSDLTDLPESQSFEEEIGIPSSLYIPRHYTMTEAARKQRRDRQSKGGKERAKKCPTPNWKHGKYARSTVTSMKPCKPNTCEKYPCELIAESKVRPGEACLDMVFVVQTYEAIMKAIKNEDYDNYNEIAAFNISQSIEVLRMCLEDIIRDGTMVKSNKLGADGKVIGFEIKPHPSLLVLPKLLAELGMTPQEAMITPRQIAKQGNEDDGMQTIADLFGRVQKLQKPKQEN
ncbi:MAG: hypothetical protein GY774_16600 [Planctomycetes bacterium]|nr:hypothetical protein [Planctomycetota bacterium]